MKNLSKTQMSLMNTVEELIYSNLFKKIMTQGRVPFEDAEINFGKWEFPEKMHELSLKVPPQFNMTLDEAEILKIIDEFVCLTTFSEKRIIIKTNPEELFNFLLFLVRQSKGY